MSAMLAVGNIFGEGKDFWAVNSERAYQETDGA
jgi:hypothetical protein